MSIEPPNPDDAAEEDRIAEILANYDDALFEGSERELPSFALDLSPEATLRLERIERGLRRLHTNRDLPLEPHTTSQASSKIGLDYENELRKESEMAFHTAPKRFGRFEIVRELGSGGLGVVLLAHDPVLKRLVAIKIPRPAALFSRNMRARFLREAQAAARLTHPNLMPVLEVGHVGSICFIAASFCEGPSLSEWIKTQSGPVTADTAAQIITALADGIEYAHSRGVLHRDLKPANVLLEPLSSKVGPSGDRFPYTARITDFGLAKLESDGATHTRTGSMMGTLSYMAPEQAETKGANDGRQTDIYGLGAILYELLTQSPPFCGQNDSETLRQLLHEDPVSPRVRRPDLPRDLEAICLKCLEKNPLRRYASAASLASDLQRFLSGEPTLARPLARTQRLTKWVLRRPAAAGLLTVIVAAAVAISVLTATYVARLREANHVAEISRNDAQASAMQSRILEGDANKYLYVSRMRDAYRSLEQGDAAAAPRLLQHYEDGERWSRLRGFEWHHLNRQMRAERLTLTHGCQVYSVVYSPDGKVVASGGEDGLIKLWDQADGRLVASLTGHASCVNGLAYSQDGRTLISVSCDHTVKLWDVANLQLTCTLEEHAGAVHSLALSPDGKRFATGGMESQVVVWDLATGRALETVASTAINVDFIAWRDDHNLVFTGGTHLDAWNVDTGETQLIHGLGRSIAISPNNGDLVLGTNDGSVRSVSGPSIHGGGSLGGRGCRAASLKFLPLNGWLAVGYDDGAVRISSWPEPDFRQMLSAHAGRVQSLAAAPMTNELATGSFDGTVKLWNLRFDSLPRIEAACFVPPAFGLGSVIASSADFSYIALPTSIDQVEVFEVESKRSVAKRRLANQLCTLRFSGDVIVGYGLGGDSIVRWDWKHDVFETMLTTAATSRSAAAISPDGRQLVTLCSSPAVSDTLTGLAWWVLPAPMRDFEHTSLVFSPNGEYCCMAGTVGQANSERSTFHQLFNLRTKQTQAAPIAGVLALTEDLVVVDGPQQVVIVVNRESGKEISRFVSSPGQQGLQISPDGRTVAAGDIDGHVSLWNVATGQLIATLNTDGSAPADIRFSEDSRKLAAFTVDSWTSQGQFARATCKMFMWSGTADR